MAKYHKLAGTDMWHWSRSCSRWPGAGNDTIDQDRRPSYDLCPECKSREAGDGPVNQTDIEAARARQRARERVDQE